MTPATRDAVQGIAGAVVVFLAVGMAVAAVDAADWPVRSLSEPTAHVAEPPVPVSEREAPATTEDRFIASLAYTYPVYASERIDALAAGYLVCWGLDSAEDPVELLDAEFNTDDLPDRYLSVVAAATSNLCPDHEATGRAFVNGGWRS